MKRSLIFGALGLICLQSHAQDLRIVPGIWDAQGVPCSAIRILEEAAPFGANAIVDIDANGSAAASLVNLDSLEHTLIISDVDWAGVTVAPGDTVQFNWPELTFGTYRYHLSGLRGEFLQASGILRVGVTAEHRFVWNLADLQSNWMDAVANGMVPIWEDYLPDFFTINEAHYPNTLEDEQAVVALNLGDTAVISIANAGQMDHVLHFHGYHVEILQSTRLPSRTGWIKDSVPIRTGEGLTLQLVPDQTGTYPVHDHNLIAVTNAGFYPGGMLTHIIVEP